MRDILGLKTVQKNRILALLLKVVDQRLGVALNLCVNQTDMDILFQEVIGKQLRTIWRDFEGLADIALQRIDARAATMEIAFHLAEQRLQLQQIVSLLLGIAIINGSH